MTPDAATAGRDARSLPEVGGLGALVRWRKRTQSAPVVILWTDHPSHHQRLEPMLRMLGFECVLVEQISLDFVALAERSAVAVIAATSIDSASPFLYLRTAGLSLPILVLCDRPDQVWKDDATSIGPELSATMPHSTRELGVLLAGLAQRSSVRESRAGAGAGFWLDPVGLKVGYHEKTAKLQFREAAILHCFVRHAGVALTPVKLGTYVWGDARPRGQKRIIAVHVCHLRRKLKAIGLSNVIRTMKGDGAYQFDLPAH